MKTLLRCAVSALCVLGAAHCQAQTAPPESASKTAPAATMTQEEFYARVISLNKGAEWTALQQVGREWLATHPDDTWAIDAQARGSYMLGDLDLAIESYQKLIALTPNDADNSKFWLGIALSARRNFPGVQLKPIEFVSGDVSREQDEWKHKGAALLVAKQFDEIEKTARALQRTKAADVAGTTYLHSFFKGVSDDENLAALQSRIAAWRVARPKSDLARLAALSLWTNTAWKARGHDFASSITPAMSARMDAALERGAQVIKTLPETAFASPLAFEAVMSWGQLASQPREFFDHFFETATARFPADLPLYSQRANLLLPRWFGEAGEWEAMAKKRADQIGGENGDVFYARIVWSQSRLVSLPEESQFDYKRARRGLEILQKRHPDSISVASARLATACQSKDWASAKQVLTAPQGHLLADSWWLWDTPRNRAVIIEKRIAILGDATDLVLKAG